MDLCARADSRRQSGAQGTRRGHVRRAAAPSAIQCPCASDAEGAIRFSRCVPLPSSTAHRRGTRTVRMEAANWRLSAQRECLYVMCALKDPQVICKLREANVVARARCPCFSVRSVCLCDRLLCRRSLYRRATRSGDRDVASSEARVSR